MSDAGYNTYMTGKWHLGYETRARPAGARVQALVRLAGRRRASRRLGLARSAAGALSRWRRDRQRRRRLLHDALLHRAHDRVHRAGPCRGQAVLRVPRVHGAALAAAGARRSRSRDSRAATTLDTRRYMRAVSRGKRAGPRGADAQPIDDARFRPAGASSRRRRSGSKRGAWRSTRRWSATSTATSATSSHHLERTASSTTPSSCSCPTTVPSPTGATSCPPISEHIGKEYDHSLENLGRATSYVMYGANWASVSAAPFSRHKGTAFEGGVHVPAFVHFPRIVAPGTRSDAHRDDACDLLPTFLALAGTRRRQRTSGASGAAGRAIAAADAARRSRYRARAGRRLRVGAVRPSLRASGRLEDRVGSGRPEASGAGSCSTSPRSGRAA